MQSNVVSPAFQHEIRCVGRHGSDLMAEERQSGVIRPLAAVQRCRLPQ